MAFDAKRLLNELLETGQAKLRDNQGTTRRGDAPAEATDRGAMGDLSERLGGFGGFGGGALTGGALGLLLGDRRVRKFGGGILGYGGSALLGALAHRAYSEWQKQQGSTAEPRTLDRVPGSEANVHSMAVLKAMVGASRADGHIDDRERALIETEIERIDDAPELKSWLDDQLRKPLDPADIASAATSGEIAAEMYLASRMMIDSENYMERAYLDELARCLELDRDLQSKLDQEVEATAEPATPADQRG